MLLVNSSNICRGGILQQLGQIKKKTMVGADWTDWCFYDSISHFLSFPPPASLLLVSLPLKPNAPPEGLHQAACCWVTKEDCGSEKLSVEFQKR